jgi:futalosine hydrolase
MNSLIVCATPLEAEYVLSVFNMKFTKEKMLTGVVFYPENKNVPTILVTGIGKTNSALVLTHFINTRFIPEEVINTGIAGAYPGSGISVGHIAVASEEVYADEGVLTEKGFQSLKDLGFPSLVTKDNVYFNIFPIENGKKVQKKLLKKTKLSVFEGRFITVSECSASPEREIEMAKRFNPLCESMEGCAVLHTCLAYEIPFIEIRGISNFTGSYDKSGWHIEKAMGLAAKCVKAYFEED